MQSSRTVETASSLFRSVNAGDRYIMETWCVVAYPFRYSHRTFAIADRADWDEGCSMTEFEKPDKLVAQLIEDLDEDVSTGVFAGCYSVLGLICSIVDWILLKVQISDCEVLPWRMLNDLR